MATITEIRRKLPILPSKGTGDAKSVVNTVHDIPVDDIIPNRSQPRSAFNQNAILRLSDSIKRYGVLQPLTVRKVLLPGSLGRERDSTAVYELIAGERRLRAAKLAEMTTVPCIIVNTDDATSAELAIIENLLRENLNMFEQADAFARLINEFHLTQEEAARRVSMSQSAVANKLRILRLSADERARILAAGLTERHARALLKIPDEPLRDSVLQHIIDCKMNVSTTESYIDGILLEMARFRLKEQPPEALAKDAESAVQSAVEETIRSIKATAPPQVAQKPRFKGSIKDVQLFYNSVQNALQILEQTGVQTDIRRDEQENQVTLTIQIKRS